MSVALPAADDADDSVLSDDRIHEKFTAPAATAFDDENEEVVRLMSSVGLKLN